MESTTTKPEFEITKPGVDALNGYMPESIVEAIKERGQKLGLEKIIVSRGMSADSVTEFEVKLVDPHITYTQGAICHGYSEVSEKVKSVMEEYAKRING